MGGPRIGSGLSWHDDAEEAARAAAHAALEHAGGAPVDLAFLFLSAHHLGTAAGAAAAARAALSGARLVGCVAEGVVGGRRELESGPGMAIWTASLPGARIEPFHVRAVETSEGVAFDGFPQLGEPSLVALLVDPFTFPAEPFLGGLNQEYPGLPVVGGLAAGGHRPGLQALLLDGETHQDGAVGAVVSGVPVRTVVSQGCLPIGHDLVITRCEGNVVYELAGRPAIEQLRRQLQALGEAEQRKALRGLVAGLVIDENRPDHGRGDYLVRGLLGGDEDSGALVLGDAVRTGQTLRFHVRDAESADADLRAQLGAVLGPGATEGAPSGAGLPDAPVPGTRAAGALLFTCNGRGAAMFGAPDHDAALVADAIGGDAVAGFFCSGEIGPVGGRAFMHGFTATLAVFLRDAA